MSGPMDDEGRLTLIGREHEGHLLAAAREMLAVSAEEEGRFLARLERLDVRPAGRHRRRLVVAVAACGILGVGITAMALALGPAWRPSAGVGDAAKGASIVPPQALPEESVQGSAADPGMEAARYDSADLIEEPPSVESGCSDSLHPPEPHQDPDLDHALEPVDVDGGAEFEAPAVSITEDARLLARIALQRGSDVPAEQRLEDLQAFLARFPSSVHAGEVQAMTVEALADAGRYDEALAEVELFLAHHPDDPRRPQVRWVEATIARDRLQDCARALPAYEELAACTGPLQAEAARYVEVCAP